MKKILPALAVALLATSPVLAGSPVVQPQKTVGFAFSGKEDLSGFYMPKQELRAGRYKLIMIGLGLPEDFADFLKGERWEGKWAPILLTFAPVGSKPKPGAEGGVQWQGSFRVLPNSFHVTDNSLAFSGTEKKVGRVSFTGSINLAVLKSEKAAGPGGTNKVVLTGDLSAAGKSQPALAFTWFGGD
jgi:hypothetical protein